MSLPDVYNEYREIAKDDIPRMSEVEFKNRILPELLKKNRGQQANYDYWISIIGVPHREIMVVDEKNQELFRVPPILSRLPTDISQQTRISVAGLADLYQKRRSVENPAMVDLWFNQSMNNLSPDIHDEDQMRFLRHNLLIYTRYGIPTRELLGDLDGQLIPKPLTESETKTPGTSDQLKAGPSASPSADDYSFEDDSLHDL